MDRQMLLLSNMVVPTFHDTPVVRVAEQGYRMRLLAFGLAFVAAAVVLDANGAALVWPALFALNACAWPAVARAFALRSADPRGVEIRNLLIDSALGGVWIALLQFNLLACTLLIVILSCDKVIAGGWSLLLRGLVVQAAACVLTLALHGLKFAPQSSTMEILAALPLLIAYPLVLGMRLRRMGTSADADAPPGGELAGDTHIA
jgi:diguanylate cyclase